MKTPTFDEMLNASDADWRSFMNVVASASKLRSARKMNTFDYGARVTFVARGVRYNGIVLKFNRKTVAVRTDGGTTWRVSPSLLSHAKATEKVA